MSKQNLIRRHAASKIRDFSDRLLDRTFYAAPVALAWRRFAPAGSRAVASPLRRQPASEDQRSAADRQDREDPLGADRLENLKPGQNDPRISERSKAARACASRRRRAT